MKNLIIFFVFLFPLTSLSAINTCDDLGISCVSQDNLSNALSLKEEISAGNRFYITFDCDTGIQKLIGTLRTCGASQEPYVGLWNGEGIRLTGYHRTHKERRTYFYDYPSYHKGGSNLSLWGFMAYFDEDGNLYQQGTHKKIGRIWTN